ncbi:MAG: DUF4157 domain-containing protein [Dehalococcoidia bacterium]|nr:DUF4157 domain-containing protein [Dehalococcoidia bacterium]
MSDRVSQLSEPEQVARHRADASSPAVERPRVHPLVSIQGHVGNAAVARMIQREGMEEEEPLQGKHDVQRAGEEEEPLQGKHDLQRAGEEEEPLQGKHDLQRAGEEEDPLQGKHDLQRAGEEEEPLQGKRDLQRADDEEELQARHDQRPEVGLEGGQVSAGIQDRINSARGSGSTLDDGVRSQMESGFGADFSDVRIHRDAEADSLNRSITAKAFTTGSDIFFRGDVSESDHHTLAHELTHVVQQRSGAVNTGPGMSVGAADHSSEAEADATATAVLAGNAQHHADDEHA